MVFSHQESVGKKITRNTLFNMLGFAWQGIVLLFLIPYIIIRVGNEQYGIWALLIAVVSYFSLIDVAGGATLTKYVAEYYSKQDSTSLAKLVNNGALFYLALVLLILGIGFALCDPILSLLDIPSHLRAEAKVVYRFALVIFSLFIFSNVFTSVINGLQRMDIFNGVTVVVNALKIVGVVFVLESGWGVRGIVMSDAVVGLCSLLLMLFFAKRLYPPLVVNPFAYDSAMLKQIIGFGSKLQVSNLGELINFQLDKILLSRFLGVQFVTFYDIGSRLLKSSRGFPLLVISSLVPAVSELTAQDNYDKIVAIYRKGSKYLVTLAAFVFGFFLVAAGNVVRLWVGTGYELSVVTMRILCAGYFVNLITGIVAYTSVGIGKPGYLTRVAFIQTSGNVVFSVMLILTVGYYGAAIGTTLALSIGGLYFIGSFGKEVRDTLLIFFRTVLLRPVIAALIAGVITWVVDYGISAFFLHPTARVHYIPLLMLNILLFGFLYLFLMKISRYFEKEDWQMLRRGLPRRFQRFVSE